MIVYNYNPTTKEFICESEAQLNPVTKEDYIIPANSTEIEPLKSKDGFAICFSGNKWEYKEDHRGEIWFYIPSNSKKEIDFIGSITKDYCSIDSKRANPPEGNYWQYDADLDEWVANVPLYKQYVLSNFSSYWTLKQDTPYEFEGYYYLPSWRDLYTSIYLALKEGVKKDYTLQDAVGNYIKVDFNSMKNIYIKMANIVDEMYNDKHKLEVYFKEENDYTKLNKKLIEWLEKVYK